MNFLVSDIDLFWLLGQKIRSFGGTKNWEIVADTNLKLIATTYTGTADFNILELDR